MTIVAVVWANSPFEYLYHHIWHEIEMGFSFAGFELKGELHYWVNDFLMVIFFFVIGLEIKREIIAGELSNVKSAILPVGAAVGGMLIPALVYVLFNYDNPDFSHGWGIPMATDIAFALGLMSLLGDRVNPNLKIFLTALAIADDLGAILVIALFYTESIDMMEIFYAFIFLGVLIAGNMLGVRRATFYAVVGLVGVWLSFIYSGVHATIAGVLIAFTIPSKTKISGKQYIDKLRTMLIKSSIFSKDDKSILSADEVHTLSKVSSLTKDAESPSHKLEHVLHPVATFFILPVFALANAGVHIDDRLDNLLFHPISLGIIAGLVIGKFLGVSLFTRLMISLKITELPEGVDMKQIYGVAFLAGIGFTMSIFISDLAFVSNEYIQIAKVGVFAASIIAATIGMLFLHFGTKEKIQAKNNEK